MSKAEVRQDRLEARRAMSPAEVARKSGAIVERLKTLPAFTSAEAFLCYVSSKDNEVDTHGLINWLLNARRMVLVPIAEPHGGLVWSRIRTLDVLLPGRFGILEPREAARRVMRPPPNSVVIVPGVAFTPDGYRVGYGGGYFDRFLAHYGGPIIGLAFDLQIVSYFEIETHDIPMDFLVTETAIYRNPGL